MFSFYNLIEDMSCCINNRKPIEPVFFKSKSQKKDDYNTKNIEVKIKKI